VSGIYDRLASAADRMLRGGKGIACTLVDRTSGSYDPDTGGSTVSATNRDAVGVRFPVKEDEIDGTLILRSDSWVLLSPTLAVDPAPLDAIVFAGETLEVVDVKTIKPDGATAVLHKCLVRKGA
jgi:hypothetical protein